MYLSFDVVLGWFLYLILAIHISCTSMKMLVKYQQFDFSWEWIPEKSWEKFQSSSTNIMCVSLTSTKYSSKSFMVVACTISKVISVTWSYSHCKSHYYQPALYIWWSIGIYIYWLTTEKFKSKEEKGETPFNHVIVSPTKGACNFPFGSKCVCNINVALVFN